MKLQYLIALVAVCVLMITCSKDKYTSQPHLDLQLINGSSFSSVSDIKFKFIVTDKEGDIQDTMWVQKLSLTCPNDENAKIPTPYLMPLFTGTKNLKVELDINYTYGSDIGAFPSIYRCESLKNDSLYFRFWMSDRAGHVSDTVTSETITLLKD